METPLETRIKTLIQQLGPIDMGQYMQMCIQHYYATRDPFGTGGDFVTAPEISQTFGEMLGVCLLDAWVAAGKPDVHLVEIGGGRGTLMRDILRIAKIAGFNAQVHMVENSPHLSDVQRKTLEGYNPIFHEEVATLPHDLPLLIVANEFLDALPVRQGIFHDGHWLERVVCLTAEGTLGFGARALPAPYVPNFTPDEGSIYEFSPVRDSVMLEIAKRIMNQGGLFLTLDYGHEYLSPTGDTVQAMYKHQYCSIFEHIGEADMTAHVDFARVASIGRAQGCTIYGSFTQRDFLMKLGIEVRAEQLARAGSDTVQNDVMRLIDPLSMGKIFRAIAVGDGKFVIGSAF